MYTAKNVAHFASLMVAFRVTPNKRKPDKGRKMRMAVRMRRRTMPRRKMKKAMTLRI